MTSILDDELIKKYFGQGPCLGEPKIYLGDCKHSNCMALRVLNAQHEPIRKGEHVLQVAGDNVYDTSAQFDMDNSFHSRRNFLRIPSKFQERGEEIPLLL